MEEMNVSALSVGEMTETIGNLYVRAIQSDVPMKNIPAVFLWGPPGVGKSDGVLEIAELIRKQTGRKTIVTDVRLLLFSPIDLRGVPVPDEKRECTKWLRPQIFNLDASPDTVNILFLDELTAAPQGVQAAAYQICLDRTVGEHRLPDNTIVIAAGNRTTDRSVAFRMPNALANRLLHVRVKVDFDSWVNWAVSHDVHPLVLGYLSFTKEKLLAEPGKAGDIAWPTPRSWMAVSRILTTMDVREKGPLSAAVQQLICGCIGTGDAAEFASWCEMADEIPQVSDIFAGNAPAYPKRQDVLYALVKNVVRYAGDQAEVLTAWEYANLSKYAHRFPADYAALMYRGLLEIPAVKLQLMKSKACREELIRLSVTEENA